MQDAIVCSVLLLRCVDEKTKKAWRDRFTYTPRLPHGAPVYARKRPLCLYKETASHMIVPRDPYLLCQLMSARDVQINQPVNPRFRFRGELDANRKQPEAVHAVLTTLRASSYGGGAMLVLPTGYGKTMCAAYIVCQISSKVLVLVHTTVLASQWKDRLAQSIPEACVRVMSPVDYGSWEGADVVVVLLQTLLARSKPSDVPLCELFDMVIIDESHHLAAPTLSRAMEIAGCRYRLGLSATLERQDGMETMLHHIVGPVAYRAHRQENPGVIVHVHRYHCNNPEDGGLSQLLSATARDGNRTMFIINVLLTYYALGRYMVVMSDRRHLLNDLATRLKEGGIPVAWAVGGEKAAPDVTSRPIILATYAFASEGMDIAELDTCVLATSRCELRQCVGRILRRQGHNPWVIDIVDHEFRKLRVQFGRRKKWYLTSIDQGGLGARLSDDEA